jgi:hypothetical protein
MKAKQFIDLVASNTPIGSDLNDSKVGRITGLQPSIAIEQRKPWNESKIYGGFCY